MNSCLAVEVAMVACCCFFLLLHEYRKEVERRVLWCDLTVVILKGTLWDWIRGRRVMVLFVVEG